MIEKLLIRNYLIIKETEVEFYKGLNILTGETGAGKSIIIDALSLILGERADYSKIKKDQEKLIVEAVFNLKGRKDAEKMLGKLLEGEIVDTESIIIRRELLRKGISRNFINDTPVNISDMKKLGDMIIDIHSQNEHQSLLSKETHLELLDNYSLPVEIKKEYDNNYGELKNRISEYEEMISRKEEFIGNRKMMDFELKEINNINIQNNEDSELENELKKLEHAEDISIALDSAIKVLYEEETSSVTSLKFVIKELKKISTYDNTFEKIIEDIESSYIVVKESSDSLTSYRDKLNFDNNRIEEIRVRLSAITHLKKKYGMNAAQLIERSEVLQKELVFAENFDYELEKILNQIIEIRKKVFQKAKEMFELRKKNSAQLEKKINLMFKEVGLESAEFKVNLTNEEGSEDDLLSVKDGRKLLSLGKNGYNDVEFLIKANKGSEFTPLRKSASGGEISRIMLSIKTVLSEKDKVGILVFDEIDTGISGRIAQKVGKILKSLSKTHQIICITHLPQIAAMSEKHFHVSKAEEGNETIASIRNLTEEEKIVEVAKLLSGEQVTIASKQSAKELINS
ncbi:MAG: DNA repair protein RecN [bacterium]|nr:DNA repair protein RecN [bacterium]